MVDDVEAHLLVQAIGQWRRGTAAMARGGVSRVSVVLGISRKTEGERERGSRERRERRSRATLSGREAGSGGRDDAGEARATARVATARGRG